VACLSCGTIGTCVGGPSPFPALVASAPKGRRNEQLNESAFALFRFVVDDLMAADPIVHSLAAAARHAGLADREIQSTIRSAAQARGVPL
jgi:hypothetical protein